MSKSFWKNLYEGYAIDLRSLALFRMFISAMSLVAFWSFFFLFDSLELKLVSLLGGISSLLVIIGYKTKLFTIISAIILWTLLSTLWVLLSSVPSVFDGKSILPQSPIWWTSFSKAEISIEDQMLGRGIITLAGGYILSIYLIWSFFFPLNAVYSIDRFLGSEENTIYKTLPKNPDYINIPLLLFRWSLGISGLLAAFFAFNFVPTLWLKVPLKLYLQFLLPVFCICWALRFLLPLKSKLFSGNLISKTLHCFIFAKIVFSFFLELDEFTYFLSASSIPLILCWNPKNSELTTLPSPPPTHKLRMYYDVDCGFCKKMVYLIRGFLLLEGAQIIPAQSDPVYQGLMESKNSWVVVDAENQSHTKFQAMALVFSYSPLFSWVAPTLKRPVVMSLSTRLYETIAKNRSKASFFLRWLQFKPYHLRPSPWVEKLQAALASLLFLAMLYSMADSVLLAQQTGKPNLCLTRSWQYPLWVCEEHLRNLPSHSPVKLK